MTLSELKALATKEYGPAFTLRRVLHRDQRLAIERNLALGAAVLFMLALLAFAAGSTEESGLPLFSQLSWLSTHFWGVFLVLLSAAFVMNSLEAMYRSYYFRGLNHILEEKHTDTPISFEVAVIVEDTAEADITGGFLNSTFGQEILYRCGITIEAYNRFMQERTPTLTTDTFSVETGDVVTLPAYARSVASQDPAFSTFLAREGVNGDHLVQAAEWVTWIERDERTRARWWSRDSLGRIPGIGKTWGYGETYLLTRYGHDLVDDHLWSASVMAGKAEEDEVEAMEKILSRSRQSNALIVGEDLLSVRQKVAQLYFKIRQGKALPPLEGKRVFFIDIEAVLTAHADKASFETELNRLLAQAVHGGNIVLYFESLTTATQSAHTIGVDLVDRLLPYLNSSAVQILAATTPDGLYGTLQRDTRLMQAFDVVRMSTISNEALLDVLRQRAVAIERRTGVVYSIPAIDAVARMADRYFPTGVMPDKAYDLLEELAPMALQAGADQLTASDVEHMVAQKTGIPVGEPTKEESAKLLSLEDFLHRRVVGQDRAVEAVAKALRRARAGIGGGKRPMGSFMFLGPTGVGKTETAKALAEALFNDENAMSRIDMSEFRGADALERLIGSPDGRDPGRLSTLIREKPYGVLLFDEFEKSERNVHDLFLQVLDEGRFTDAMGKAVNAQNLIIIATSNAGADIIWQWEKERKNVAELKRALIDHIISQGIYRPEFLNRFDDIVVFNTLSSDQVRAIAKFQLEALRKRLRDERMIQVAFADDVVDYVASVGFDPQFGGRPMRRAIQEKIEQAIADKILAGDIRSGQEFTMHAPDSFPKKA